MKALRPFALPLATLLAAQVALMLACGGGGGAGASSSAPVPQPKVSGSLNGYAAQTPQAYGGTPQAPATLSAQGLDNLVAFTRVAGLVRIFYPGDEAAAAPWDTVFVEGLRQAEAQPTPEALATFLQSYFALLAPELQVFPASAPPALPPDLQRSSKDLAIIHWVHTGWGANMPSRDVYHDDRMLAPLGSGGLPPGYADPASPYEQDLPEGLRVRVPLSLYTDGYHTQPEATATFGKPLYTYPPSDRAARLGAVAMAWTVLEHFFPYFDLVTVDWEAQLRQALTVAAADADASGYTQTRTLGAMVTPLEDGHMSLYLTAAPAQDSVPPLRLDKVEGQWVITTLLGSVPGVSVGEVITAVDGVPIAQVEADFRAVTPGSPRWQVASARVSLLAGAPGSTVHLDLLDASNQAQTADLPRNQLPAYASQASVEPRPSGPSQVAPGVWYLDLETLTSSQLDSAMPSLGSAKAVIADMRGYPGDYGAVFAFLQHLVGSSGASYFRLYQPVVSYPDDPQRDLVPISGWGTAIPPLSPTISCPVFILQDGRTMSAAESFLGSTVQTPQVRRVGDASAGADGYVTDLNLVAGFDLGFSGERADRADGAQMQVCGVTPTDPKSRTLAGVRAGKDEVLEYALSLANP